MNSFTLEGVTYSCQYRTCTKPTCSCQTEPNSKGHGPYWYCRVNGRVRYIGRHLPAHIERAHEARCRRLPTMEKLKEELQDQVSALHAHIHNSYISPGARQILIDLGFGDTLTASDKEVYGPED